MIIAIVVGEVSGDILGANLISALKEIFPTAIFEGIGGEKMCSLGFNSLFPMERLAVMGLVEPLKRLPELLSIRKQLKHRYTQNKPNVFIGIDAPDFNLNLEQSLKVQGVKTVHYVSPSVWAWREKRVFKVVRSADLLLTLFPFEKKFYRQHDIAVECVGHTLADQIPLEVDAQAAKTALGIDQNKTVIGLLPGSRSAEVERLFPVFLAAAEKIQASVPNVIFIVAAANKARQNEINHCLESLVQLNKNELKSVKVFLKQSHEVMTASDVILIASGTATLEATLLKKPMVIAYKMAALSFHLLSKMVKVPYIGIPNLLAEKKIVPEFIQNTATADSLSEAVIELLLPEKSQKMVEAFNNIHLSLRKDAGQTAAKAIEKLLIGQP